MVNNRGGDIDTAKSWYIRLLKEQLKIEPEFKRVREQQETIYTQLTGLDQFLRAAKVDVEALRAMVKPVTETEVERSKPDSLPNAIAQVLETAGEPRHYKNITSTLIDRGFDVPGKDPANTVLAYISRYKGRFTKAPEVGKGYHKLKEWEK